MQSSQFEQFISRYRANWPISSDDIAGWREELKTIHIDAAMDAMVTIQNDQITSGKPGRFGPKVIELKAVIYKKRPSNSISETTSGEGCDRCMHGGWLAVLCSSSDRLGNNNIKFHDLGRFDLNAPLENEYHKKTVPCSCEKGQGLKKYTKLSETQHRYLSCRAYSIQRIDAMVIYLQLLSDKNKEGVSSADFNSYRSDLVSRIFPDPNSNESVKKISEMLKRNMSTSERKTKKEEMLETAKQ